VVRVTEFGQVFRDVASHMLAVAESDYLRAMNAAVSALEAAVRRGNKILVFGNGGSAADAEHLAAELLGRFTRHRDPVAAIALTSNPPFLTAWSNDYRFDDVFERQVAALGKPGDVAWGISTSGDSANVVNALGRARAMGATTIGLTGRSGGRMAEHCDVLMAVPLTDTPRIQEVHLVTYHAICGELELRLFAPPRETT
jgi:D-sedoheptulose 7-phosphate isomerase